LHFHLPHLARFFILYEQLTLLAEIDKLEFAFSTDQAKALFFSTSHREMKMIVLRHANSEFKTSLSNIVTTSDHVISLKNGTTFTSSDVYMHISDCTAVLSPENHAKVRKELGIEGLSLADFISACDAGNYPLVKSMIDIKFPAFIRKRDHLTRILRGLCSRESGGEWDQVFEYVKEIADKDKAKLHVEDTICFMVRDFFASKKASLSALTNWERPPEFTGGTPLLTNYTLLRELETNKKLAYWNTKPRRSKLDVHVSQNVDPRCLKILIQYGIFGCFYN
jgi:hypothetical protein